MINVVDKRSLVRPDKRPYPFTFGAGRDALLRFRRGAVMNVDEAIRVGLDRCRGQDAPLDSLATFLDELRQEGWGDLDLRVVERAVVRLLGTILD